MTSADGIRDEASLRAWLEGRPREDVLRIAVRAHSRIVPTRWFGRKGSPGGATDPLDLRYILRSWVEVGKAKPADAHTVRADPLQIDVACDAVSNTARNPYDFDSNYARASVASGQIWAQVPADALAWEKGEDPLATPLWPLSEPERFRAANAEMRTRWLDQFPELCGFWLRWWDGVVSGQQIDWALQEKVTLIPDAIWDQGPAAVAAEIARIEADYRLAATPNAERISVNPHTGLLRAEPLSDLPEDHLADACDMLRDAQSVFRPDGPGRNVAGLVVEERQIVDDALGRYARRPRMLHNACLRVLRRIAAKRAGALLPEDDHQILDYEAQIRNVADHLMSFDTEVRDSVTARLELRIKIAAPSEAASIKDASLAVATVAEGYLANELPEDAEVIADESLPDEERKDSLFRTASRLLRVYALLAAKGVKLVYKGARWSLSEAAGIAGDLKKIAEAVKPVAIAIFIILALL